MKEMTVEMLESLALGASILGSGGGGSPSYIKLITKRCLELKGPVQVITPSELTAADLVVPIAYMGAPLVALEKIPNEIEIRALFSAIEKTLQRKPTALVAAEIGGSNAFTAIWAASLLGLPVVDADTIGRAFPELQMSSCTLHQISPAPAFLADSSGNTVTIHSSTCQEVERFARTITVAMGSRAAVALYMMDGEMAKKCLIPGTVSQAIAIGRVIQEARQQKQDPTEAVVQVAAGKKLCSGVISDIDHRVEGGFLQGLTTIISPNQEKTQLRYQNEYLLATQEDLPLGCTPDILMLMEQETGTPITSSLLSYGLRVDLFSLPAPAIWKTPQGLELVGPHYFGYERHENKPLRSKR